MSQTIQNLHLFNKLFISANFTDSFSWSPEWNEEAEKWLTFINEKDSSYYEAHKKRAQSDKQRDELLGEYKAAYFIGEKLKCKIVKFEPDGRNNKKLDFLFKDKDGAEWFAEVKSPSWRNEVSKEIDDRYFRELRSHMTMINCEKWLKYTAEIICPMCHQKVTFEIKNISDDEVIDRKIKELICSSCCKHIWNSLEPQRTKEKKDRLSKPQFTNDGGGSFSSIDAIEDAVRKSVEQFQERKNNLLIIVPNMSAGPTYGSLAVNHEQDRVRDILKKYDKNKVIKAVLVLEVSLPAFSKTFDYEKNIILFEGKAPALGK